MQNLHKLKSFNFGNKYAQETLQDRLDNHNKHRKHQRTLYMLDRRNIQDSTAVDSKEMNAKSDVNQKKAEERMEMLKKWKEEKELRLKKAKESAKPLFKVFHVSKPIVDQNLDEVYKKIKGKPVVHKPQALNTTNAPKEANVRRYTTRSQTKITTEKSKENNRNTTSKDVNVKEKTLSKKTKNLSISKTKGGVNNDNIKKSDKETKQTKQEKPLTRQLRNKKIPVNSSSSEIESNVKINIEKLTIKDDNVDESNVIEIKTNAVNSSLSPEYPISDKESADDTSSGSTPNCNTPNKINAPVAYVSPFVTISRGKARAREEYKMRKSREDLSKSLTLSDANECTSPKAGAAYFYKVLGEQVERISALCEKWEKIKVHEQPPEEACDSINSAVGQSQLLLNKKFKQFRVLIDQCANTSKEDLLVTCEDLHGYWDMVHREIVDIDRRYDDLEKLKQNNWVEVLVVANKTVVKKQIKKKKVTAKSRLADVIKAARQKNKENVNKVDDGIVDETTNLTNRKSVLNESVRQSLRRSSTRRQSEICSSPGLTMMAASLTAKKLNSSTKQTPNKSILKSAKSATKSAGKKVFFGDDFNVDDSFSLINWNTPEVSLPRRSTRLSSIAKSKLCF